MSVPLAIFEKLPADKLAGKVVLDQTNYYPGMGGFRRADLDKGELTSSELMQRHLSGATLIKGLHNLSWIHMESNARPGNIGSRLARAWAAAGHDLVIAKDGEDRKIAPLLAELGERAGSARFARPPNSARSFYFLSTGPGLMRSSRRWVMHSMARP